MLCPYEVIGPAAFMLRPMHRAQHSWLDVRLFCTTEQRDADGDLESMPLVDHSHEGSAEPVPVNASAWQLVGSRLEAAQPSYSLSAPVFLRPRY